MPKEKLSSKRQLSIPKKIRERLDLKRGDVLSVEETDDGILLRTFKKASWIWERNSISPQTLPDWFQKREWLDRDPGIVSQ